MNDVAKEGQMVYKNLPDIRKTIENMSANQWYSFPFEHYHAFFMHMKSDAKRDYHIQVKQQDRITYVKKQTRKQ